MNITNISFNYDNQKINIPAEKAEVKSKKVFSVCEKISIINDTLSPDEIQDNLLFCKCCVNKKICKYKKNFEILAGQIEAYKK